MSTTRLFGIWCGLFLLSSPVFANADVPPWMRDAAARKTPTHGPKVSAVVLLDEERVKVENDGKVITTNRHVIRILSREGRGFARARAIYRTDGGKVREIKAWTLGASGQVTEYEKNQVVDTTVGDITEHDEVRQKSINAESTADTNTVFGYEAITEDRSVFTQFEWHFQGRLPVLLSRYELTLPEGWRAESVTFNHPKIDAMTMGSTYVWELRDLPEIEREPSSPVVTNLAPRLAVSFFPVKSGIGKSFSGWKDVSRWLSELNDPQAMPNDALIAKARSLTANAENELDRIREIGRYAQSIRYVSIQTGLGRGGGYRPHSAADVFAKGYGDCKDKATLMRAMLRAIDITAYPVSIYSGDATYVREEWASPQQFNHCIVAVKISKETKALSAIEHSQLGRLLIFDPTDEDTPVGDLPIEEQGSLALIVAGDAGELLRMPTLPSEGNRLDREVDASLSAAGTMTVRVRETSSGQEAAEERRQSRSLSAPDYRKLIEEWVLSGASQASVSRIDTRDDNKSGRFVLEVDFSSHLYGQTAGRLLLFKPAILSRREFVFPNEKTRKHPVILHASSVVEKARFKLPAGFVVDEFPDPVELKLVDPGQSHAPWAIYSLSCQPADGQLTCMRRLDIRAATVPVSQYEELRRFYERVRSAELGTVVLAQK